MGTTTAENTVELGTTLTYKKGDIVFWGGGDSALGRMDIDYDFSKNPKGLEGTCAKFKNDLSHYDSLYYKYLRPATSAEKAILGDREFIRFSPK